MASHTRMAKDESVPDRSPGPIWVGETAHRRTPAGLLGVPAVPTGPARPGLAVHPRFASARLLVTDDGVPVGQVDLPLLAGTATAAQLAAATATVAGAAPPARPPTSDDPITVVIATRGRPDSVRRCLDAVLAGRHPAVTVLVVDNDPPDDRTRDVVAATGDPRVRYVREARRGASVGRNRGLADAVTEVVAFTDDDTEPDPGWASRIAGAFAEDPQLTGLSGPVLAATLETPQQQAADVALAWNKGFVPRRFRLDDPPSESPVFPFSPGLFGIGANMAVRAPRVRRLGGFDEALGPGRPTRGGEDIELLVRIVLDGGTLGYLPSAFVWHHHRPSDRELREQLRGYALGLGAFLAKVALDPRGRRMAARRFPAGLARLREIVRRESAGAVADPGQPDPGQPDPGPAVAAGGPGGSWAGRGRGGTEAPVPDGGAPGPGPLPPLVATSGRPADPAAPSPRPREVPAPTAVAGDPGGGPRTGTARATRPEAAPAARPEGGVPGTRGATEPAAMPGGAAVRKVAGLVSGPLLYLRARRQVRDEGGVSPPLTRPR